MGIKKPSDYFKKESKDNENLIGKPNLSSYSEAFNSFKEHLSKFDKISDTIKIVDEIKTELQDFLKKEDLDNAMMSYVFLLEENINTLKDNVKSINTKTLTEIKSKVTDVTEVVNEFAEVELPKYKKNIIDAEVRSDKKFNQFKEEFSKLIDEVSTNIDTKQFEIESKTEENLNEVVTNLENKINDLYSGNDGLSKTIKTKVNEIKKLKKDVIEHFKINKSISKDLTEKISNLEIEIIRGENNIKEQNDNILSIEQSFKDTIDKLNIKDIEKENFVLSTKIKHLEEVYENLKKESEINETLIEETLPSTKTSDPLTPLDQNYVTLDQLQQHYRLFLGRIQTQLSTLGGGGETRLQYLDDIVGIATDLSEYNGKFLKVDTSQPSGKNFIFETVSGGGGGGSTGAGGTWANDTIGINTTKNVGIGTTAKSDVALFVEGNQRVTGILTVGSASVTIDGSNNQVNVGSATTIHSTGYRIGDSFLHSTGLQLSNINSTGIATIGNVVVGGATTDLLVNGDARVTGILTIGTGSITLNPTEKKISGIDEIEIGSGTTAITIKKSERGEIQFTDESGEEKSVGIGTTVSINTSGIITATKFSGSGEDLTGLTATQIPNLNASKINDGTLGSDRIPDLAASKITSGTFDTARIPTLNQNTSGTAAGLSGTPDITIRNLVGVAATFTGDATFNGNVSIGGTLTYEDVTNVDAVGLLTARSGIRVTGGVIEAQAGKNKIPSLYSNLGELPDAGTYHGMFAHVHSTGKGYFSHAGGWYELVNVENNGVVGTGTQRYNIGALVSTSTTATTLNVSGVSTFNSPINVLSTSVFYDKLYAQQDLHANGSIVGDNATNISGINSVTATSFYGDGSGLTGLTTSQIPDLAANKITSGTFDTARIPTLNQNTSGTSGGLSGSPNINVSSIVGTALSISGISSVGTAITMYGSSGIVSATKFCGDGSCLTGISAGFTPDADENLVAGTGAGEDLDGTNACCNVLIGYDAGKEMTSGSDNIVLGRSAMGAGTVSGTHNIVMGNKAGNCIASGSYNIFFGRYAGSTNYGNRNVAIGCMAGMHASGGQNHNVFVGTYAGCCAKSYRNIAIGYQALKKSTSGGCNVVLGDTAACAVTSGCFNLVSGFKAGLCISSGSCNIFLGKCAGNTTTTGDRNIAIGHDVELSNATGSNQLGIGSGTSLWIEGDSSYNVTLSGIATVYSATGIVSATKFCGDGSCLTGISAGFNADDQKNLFSGGTCTGCSATTNAEYNIALGDCAGKSLTNGEKNVLIGQHAGQCIAGTSHNVVLGALAGCQLGKFGYTAEGNTFLGRGVGRNAGGAAHVKANTFIGCYAGKCVTAGCCNIFLGAFAGSYAGNITGSNNVAIGRNVCLPSLTGSDQLVIGSGSNNWITGNSDFNVGIGTTNPNASVGVGNTAKLSVGIVSAYQLYGDGSALTGISAGFSPDDQFNLYAGTCAGASSDSDTCFNIGIGYSALASRNGGFGNVAIGHSAGKSSTDGYYNVHIGDRAGCGQTSGSRNIFMGRYAGSTSTTGNGNVFLGRYIGRCGALNNSTQSVVIGDLAGCKLSYVAHYNVFLGAYAGRCATSACRNTLLGYKSAINLTEGDFNVVIGSCIDVPIVDGNCQLLIGNESCRWVEGDSSYNVTLAGIATVYSATGIVSATKFCGDGSALTGISAGFEADSRCNLFAGFGSGVTAGVGTDKNIVMGFCSGYNLNGAVGNIFMGCYIGVNASGNYNIAFGRMSGLCLTTGSSNILMGTGSGFQMTTGKRNIAMGTGNLEDATGSDYNIAIGFENANVNDVTGEQNVLIGQQNARRITSGCCNTVIGQCNADCLSTANCNVLIGRKVVATGVFTGNDNVFLGQYVAKTTTSADCNVILGYHAGKNLTTGSENIALGKCAMSQQTVTGSGNIFMGVYSGKEITSGTYNIGFGKIALGNAALSGDGNLAMGCVSGKNVTSGNNNIFLGKSAGSQISSSSCNLFIGNFAGCSSTDGDHNIVIGNCANVGSSTGSNQLAIGMGVNNWIVGNSDFNVGIGTTNPNAAVGVGNTAKLSVGILSAYQLYGDGSNLTGISGGGGGSSGISTSSNQIAQQTFIGAGVTNFNFVGAGITASITNTTTGNIFVPSAIRKTTRFVATANQTTFAGLNYTVGYVDVFLNGIKLDGQDEFTATNGTSVVLTDGATVNDIVEIVAQEISANLTITGIGNVVEDTTPELGGDLNLNGKIITGSGGSNITGIVTATTFSGGVDLSGLLKEGVNITAGKLSDNTNIDLTNGMVHLFTTEETTTFTQNIRFDGSTTLNSKMSIGEAITVVIIVTADATGYSNELYIDGSGVDQEYLGGTAPAAGGASGYDVYTHNIIKTADATYVVLSNLVNFA